jgi:hypothetical protein
MDLKAGLCGLLGVSTCLGIELLLVRFIPLKALGDGRIATKLLKPAGALQGWELIVPNSTGLRKPGYPAFTVPSGARGTLTGASRAAEK